MTRWNQAATVTKWDTKTVTKNVYVAAPTPTPTKSELSVSPPFSRSSTDTDTSQNHPSRIDSLLGLDLDANVGKIASAAADLNILRQ